MRSMLFSGAAFALLAGQPLAAVTQSRAAETNECVFRTSEGVDCRLTWTGETTGWRLQSGKRPVDAGAVQKLAAFLNEPDPSSAHLFQLMVGGETLLARGADGSQVRVARDGRLSMFSPTGRLVTEDVCVARTVNGCVLSGRLAEGEAVYGLGERLDRLNKRGQRLTLYTSDGYNDSSATYLAIPFFTTPRGGGVFVNLYERMTADFGTKEKDVWRFEVEQDGIDVYLFAKDRIPDAITAYTALSGSADVPEDWNRGPIVCRYYPDLTRLDGPFVCEFRGMTLRGHGLREMMERHIALGVKPSAVIVEGGGYADLFSRPERRAELKRMVAYLKEREIRLMVYMRMGSVCSKHAPGFREDFNVSVALATNGVAVGQTKLIPDRYAKGVNPDVRKSAHEAADITDEAFWDWYVNTVWKDLVEMGVSGVKIDFCEELPDEGLNPGGVAVNYRWKNPSVFSCTAVHHAYPTFFISRFYRELSRLTVDRGGFMVLSRGGGIGSQRNPYLWAGDQQRLFEKLDDQLLAVLNAGMSGVPFMTYDLAGYQYCDLCAENDGEIDGRSVVVRRGRTTDAKTEAAIFRRGVEFSAFMPCVQSHGFVRNAYDFDEATQKHYRKYMDLHASLSNVFSRVTRDAAEKGLPPIRPLVFDYPEDTNTWDIADEFLLGDSLLVAPSFTAKPRQDVYLPKGNWKRLTDLDEVSVYRKEAGNPIDSGWYADPQIRQYGDTCWVFSTCSRDFGGQTFFDAFSTKDLKTWTKHEKILSTNAVTWARGAMWAPDAHEKDGKYYLFFSANDSYPVGGKQCDGEPQDEPGLQRYGGIGVAVADRPEGPYRDLIGKPLVDRFWNRAQPIDQYVFKYRSEWYMVYGGWGRCNLVRLSDDFQSLKPFEDGRMWKDMTPKDYVEGSVMFERQGKWYFMYSSGGWTTDNYRVNYGMGDSPFGPFEFKGCVLSSQRPLATGAGHHSVLNIPGTDDWLICYHRRPIPSQSKHHRVVCVDRMFFNEDGTIRAVRMTE